MRIQKERVKVGKAGVLVKWGFRRPKTGSRRRRGNRVIGYTGQEDDVSDSKPNA